MHNLPLLTRHRRLILAALLVVAAVSVLVDGAFGSTSTGLPSSQELPPGAVAVVIYPPAELQTITTHDFEHAMPQAAAQAGLKRTPSPGQKGYWKLKFSAMSNLLDENWIEGQAAEMGIVVTPKRIATELAQIKKQNFKTEAAYKRFLKTFHYTQSDVNELIKLQLLSTAIQEQVIRGIEGKKSRRRAVTKFVTEYTKRWRSRTVCAPGYIFGRCSNAHGSARP